MPQIQNEAIQSKLQKLKDLGIEVTPQVLYKIAPEIINHNPVVWNMTYGALKGEPYRFNLPESQRSNTRLWVRHRPFLQQMMEDQAEQKCYQKSRQAGGSENAVREAIWFLATHPGTKIMYTFPSQPQMEDFSNTRVKAFLDETPYLQRLIGSLNNVTTKEIGKNSYLLMRSAQTPRLGEGVDCDGLYIDEKDRMPDKIEAAFEQSLSSSPWRLLREFSTPTLPGVGISKSFERSCKYYWFVKCNSGHSQTLTHEDNIEQTMDVDPTSEYVVPGTYRLKCAKRGCISEINRWDGEWIAAEPGDKQKTNAGYHISQLSCVWLSPDQIMFQKLKYKFMDLFYNYVLGMPYSSAEGLITPEHLYRQNDTTRWVPNIRRREYISVVVGVDWGINNVVTVLGRRFDGKMEVAALKSFIDSADVLAAPKEIAKFIAPFEPEVIVADAGYGVDRCNYLLSQFPERVYACYYSSGSATDKTYQPSFSEQPQFKVTVNRTMHLRNMLEFIKVRRIVFPGPRDYYETFFKHILNLALIHEEEEDPKIKGETIVVERIGKKGRDDWAHSLAYALLALNKLTQGGGFSYQFL